MVQKIAYAKSIGKDWIVFFRKVKYNQEIELFTPECVA